MHDKPPGRRHRTAASDDLPTSIATGQIDARDLEGYLIAPDSIAFSAYSKST